jgi:choline dehydrogenase-like flavoprotein
MPVSKQLYDAVIVGSGASGGWVAKQLTEQGMSVLMLEAGPPRMPTRDFTEHVRPYQVKFRGFGNRQALLERQPIQRLCFACDEYSHQFFVDDHENPYTFPTVTAITSSKPPAVMVMAKTGPSATKISRRTTIWWSRSSALAARAKASSRCQTANSCRR